MPQLNTFRLCPPVITLDVPDNNYQAPCCSGGGGGGLNFVSTEDGQGITFSGNGTPGNPLTAMLESGQIISFEIAVGKLNGMSDEEPLGVYARSDPPNATGNAIIPAGMDGSVARIEDQTDDVLVNLIHNSLVVGSVSIVGGVATFTLPTDIVLEPEDLLEITAASTSDFSLLAITILGLRPLDYVV